MALRHWTTICTLALTLGACATTDDGESLVETPSEEEGSTDGEEETEELGPPEVCGEREAADATDEELAANTRADLELVTILLTTLGADEDNVLLSPYSLRSAFGQVLAGTDGESHPQIESALGFSELGDRTHAVLNSVTQQLESRNYEGDEQNPEVIVRPVNRSFFDLAFEDSVGEQWLETAQAFYGTCIEVFDLNTDKQATLDHVNGWVADQTNDLIPNLVKSLPDTVTLILVNAFYFKASWDTPFEEGFTREAEFTTRAGSTVQVEMMHQPVHQGRYAESEQWQAVTLPYSDGRLEMVVILPRPEAEADFAASLDGEQLGSIFDELAWVSGVDLELPKFDLMSTWGLKSALQSMGMEAPFANQDFDGIAEGMMPIFEVFHDVAIVIDEKGTEAAAATAVVFGEDGGEQPFAEASMVVDHTFYLAIRDQQAGALLFFARIGDPTAG